MEQKVNAVKIIYNLMVTLGEDYENYLPATMGILLSLINYQYHTDIRKFACKSLGCVVGCTKNLQTKEQMLLTVLAQIQDSIKNCKRPE